MAKNIVVLGATGLVGGGAVRSLARDGHSVLAVGRNQAVLDRLASVPSVKSLAGDVGSDDAAERTAQSALDSLGRIDVVIASLNPPRSPFRLAERPTADLAAFLDQALLAHARAAKAFIPRVAQGGVYVGVGGAAGEFVWPEHGHISLGQAAQRMLFRVLAHEHNHRGVAIREYVIAAMVHDGSGKQGVSDAQVGDDIARLVALPDFGPDAVARFPPRPTA